MFGWLSKCRAVSKRVATEQRLRTAPPFISIEWRMSADLEVWPTACSKASGVDDHMIARRTNDRSSLEALVIVQLSALRRREAELRARLQSGAPLETGTVATELWRLQASADRLSRMMDVM